MTKKEVIVPADDLVCLGKDKLPELIRCKDCVFWEHAFDDWGKCYGIMVGLATYESGFCAWAERKEE